MHSQVCFKSVTMALNCYKMFVVIFLVLFGDSWVEATNDITNVQPCGYPYTMCTSSSNYKLCSKLPPPKELSSECRGSDCSDVQNPFNMMVKNCSSPDTCTSKSGTVSCSATKCYGGDSRCTASLFGSNGNTQKYTIVCIDKATYIIPAFKNATADCQISASDLGDTIGQYYCFRNVSCPLISSKSMGVCYCPDNTKE